MLVGAIFANGGLEMGLANRVQEERNIYNYGLRGGKYKGGLG